MAFMLPTTYIRKNHAVNAREKHLITPFLRKSVAVLTLSILAAMGSNRASAQSASSEGQKLAFDRSKGNCLTCHEIKGGDLPGTIGPPLTDIKSKYPNRSDLIAIVSDESKRNAQTVMPPFGRNRILTEQEINAVVDFLQTL
jgi:sulfur-oxidizing protein SoxX